MWKNRKGDHMENVLLNYMENRLSDLQREQQLSYGVMPFITISREYGCPTKIIAKGIADKLNQESIEKRNFKEWKVVSKEILHETAKELHLDPTRIYKIINKEKRTTIDEILNALSEKYYQSDRKIYNTIATVVKGFAQQGNVVIVGRGGVAITYGIKNGIHIRLNAPIDWRIAKIMERCICKTEDEAKKLAHEIDYKRTELLSITNTKLTENPVFDISFNCAFLSADDISDTIIHIMKLKNLLKKS